MDTQTKTSDEITATQLRELIDGYADEKTQVLEFIRREPLDIKHGIDSPLYNKHMKWSKDIQTIEDNMAIARNQLIEVLNRINSV